MICAACEKPMEPTDRFCGYCRNPNPALTAAPPPDARPAPSGRYSAEISRLNPACMIFLIDRSASMEEPIAGGTGLTKKHVVADAINRILYDTVLRCSKEKGILPYFDIGIFTYGGSAEVQAALPEALVSVSKLPGMAKRVDVRRRKVPDGVGGLVEEEMQFPIWLDPVAAGNTPMLAAFRAVVGPLSSWVQKHPNSFPPIVLNLTDGAYTDGSPVPAVSELRQLRTQDGSVLLFNCHITRDARPGPAFPDDTQAASLQGLARELYDLSSVLPEPMIRIAQAKGYQTTTGSRGYAFNADQVTMTEFLDIGTRVVQDRAESA